MTGEFRQISTHRIDSLNIDIDEYEHIGTSAKHFHIAADNPENVFLVGLRTVPTDSTGVAHILEHTSLCGSEKFPVRDPFFMMIRRSLNTFMNAFTSSDWTAYPFASQNRKDYFNLLEVYLDAVFFARLDEMDFLQEGHRLEFADPSNASSDLTYKGVVFNEMKGAMSSPVSVLWQSLTKHLFPTNTYHYNSGGEPKDIPDLTYDQLKSFYSTHYHPSNAIFMTFGDIPVGELQDKIHGYALQKFDKSDSYIEVPLEKRLSEPKQVKEYYALEEDKDNLKNKTHIVLGWLLGDSTDIKAALRAHLLSSVLLDNSASPLRDALETSNLGLAPSPLCGLEDSNREMTFSCGIEGSNEEHADAVESMVLSVLQKVLEEGVEQDQVDAATHQLELSQREIGGDSYPYGLQLILSSLGLAVHRGNPVAALDIDDALAELREEAKSADFIPNLVQSLLLDNKHRVRLVLAPDPALAEQNIAEEKQKLASIKSSLSDEQKQDIIEKAAALVKRQTAVDDPNILPKVTLQDVPDTIDIPEGESIEIQNKRGTTFARGTNGISYQQLIVDVPALTPEELTLLPHYSSCLTELGFGKYSYREVQAMQSMYTGGIGSYSEFFGAVDDEQQVGGYFVMSGKALSRNHAKLSELLHDSFTEARFDEVDRIRELMSQRRIQKERSITGSGHVLAMVAASAGYSPIAKLTNSLRGLESIQSIKALDDKLNDANELHAFSQRMQALHEKILGGSRQFLLVGEDEKLAEMKADLTAQWQETQAVHTQVDQFSLPSICEKTNQGWLTSSQVSFCAKAYKTVPSSHPDSAPLAILGSFLRNGYLHRAIREQGGAYGGGASHDSNSGAFRFYSYRDPRMGETLDDFSRSVDWMLETQHDEAQLEEAILGVVSSVDKPGSPAGDAKQAFHYELQGRSKELRLANRKRLLQVTIDDLKRVTKTYLTPDNASVAVVTGPTNENELRSLNVEIKKV